MLPKVILHTEVSVDGRMDWMQDDEFLYYRLIRDFAFDAMLSGSATMLVAYPDPDTEEDQVAPPPEKPQGLQRLVVVDSRGQIRSWHQIQQSEWWGDITVLCSASTPDEYRRHLAKLGIDTIVTGQDHVDLRTALEGLNERYGIEVIRTDTGGILHGILLREGLVQEISVLLNPTLVGGTSPRSFYVAPDLESKEGTIPLRLLHVEVLEENFVWLKYAIDQPRCH